MKLNKKYCVLIDSDSGYDNQLLAKKCEKIADDFAIGFAEWVIKRHFDNKEPKNTKQLLQIYKKEKGL